MFNIGIGRMFSASKKIFLITNVIKTSEKDMYRKRGVFLFPVKAVEREETTFNHLCLSQNLKKGV